MTDGSKYEALNARTKEVNYEQMTQLTVFHKTLIAAITSYQHQCNFVPFH